MNFKIIVYSVFAVTLLFMSNCASSGTSANSSPDTNVIEVYDSSLSLADYLRRAGGVSVHKIDGRTQVRIRGNASFNSNADPLFVVDGVRTGNNYDRIESLIPIEFIESIKVLKGSEASARFGLTASSGAIIITTKKR